MRRSTSCESMTAAEAFAAIEAHQISLIPCLGSWVASAERVKRRNRFTRAEMETVSASGLLSILAVEALVRKLEADDAGGASLALEEEVGETAWA